MMQTRAMEWKVLRYEGRFPCFVRSCQAKAEHLAKMTHGEAIVQVFLCNEFGHKTPEAILFGLTMQSGWGDETKGEKERRRTEGDVK
jgi:hypothetical protein